MVSAVEVQACPKPGFHPSAPGGAGTVTLLDGDAELGSAEVSVDWPEPLVIELPEVTVPILKAGIIRGIRLDLPNLTVTGSWPRALGRVRSGDTVTLSGSTPGRGVRLLVGGI